MESSFHHKINNICINDRKSTVNIQNIQNNMAFGCSLSASLWL
jgi:hypothetical protein